MRALLPFRDVVSNWRGRPPAALEVALIALLALQAARLAWIAIGPIGPIGTADATEAATAAPIEALASWGDLFHRQAAGAATASLAGITLHGVRMDGTRSTAIIATADGQSAYRIGDRVASGLVLDAVAADHAWLRGNAGRHRIALATPAADVSRAPMAALPASTPAANGPRRVDPGQLLGTTGMRAQDGGYALVPRGNEALLRQAGLEPGDVLLAVDGEPLTPERMQELQAGAGARMQATLTVRRNGETRTIQLGRTP